MRLGGLYAKKRYGVSQIEGCWLLCCEEQQLGAYSNRVLAISAGKRAACQAIGSGFDAELYVTGPSGQLERIEHLPVQA